MMIFSVPLRSISILIACGSQLVESFRWSGQDPPPPGIAIDTLQDRGRSTEVISRAPVGRTPANTIPFSTSNEVCVAITGGAGQIAYALIPLIIHGKVFGPGRRVRLRLLDIPACSGVLEGVAMEIRDCCSDLVAEVVATTDPREAFDGADVAVLLGGFPRQPGMERRDLIARNVPIMAEHGGALASCAKEHVRVVVVANPACTNCLVASACAPSIPPEHFSSLSRLDHDRLLAVLAEEIPRTGTDAAAGPRTGVSPGPRVETQGSSEIRGACIWGNHSPTMWPDVTRAEANVGGEWVSVEELLGARRATDGRATDGGATDSGVADAGASATGGQWVSTDIVRTVRSRGTTVMEARGKSSAMSAANAIANHLRDWLSRPGDPLPASTSTSTSTSTGRWVSMGVSTNGNAYGVPGGLFFSFPVECGAGQHKIVEGFRPEQEMLEASARELMDERREALEVLERLGLPPARADREPDPSVG